MTDFNPCPFCGSEMAFVERSDLTSCYVQCDHCDAQGPIECQDGDDEETPGHDAAIRAWNTRVVITALAQSVGMREALESARGEIVLAVAFLGRDLGTDRLNDTVDSLITRLAKADADARAALVSQPSPAATVETDDVTDALNARQAAINESMARPSSSADSASLLAEADGVLSVGNAMDMSISGAWAFIKKARDFFALTEPQAAPVTDEQIEIACEAYADATNYYVKFHRGLSSPSADHMRKGMRAALSALSRPLLLRDEGDKA